VVHWIIFEKASLYFDIKMYQSSSFFYGLADTFLFLSEGHTRGFNGLSICPVSHLFKFMFLFILSLFFLSFIHSLIKDILNFVFVFIICHLCFSFVVSSAEVPLDEKSKDTPPMLPREVTKLDLTEFGFTHITYSMTKYDKMDSSNETQSSDSTKEDGPVNNNASPSVKHNQGDDSSNDSPPSSSSSSQPLSSNNNPVSMRERERERERVKIALST
jgi:hypothetical protein